MTTQPTPPPRSDAWVEHLGIVVIDEFYDAPESVRAQALSAGYERPAGLNSGPAQRCSCDQVLVELFDHVMSTRLGRTVRTNEAHFRYTTASAAKRLVCHTDWDLGDATAVVYLSRPEDCRGGTDFFRHVPDGDLSLDPQHMEDYDYHDPGQWQLVYRVPMAFNRCVVFPAARFHGVAPPFFGGAIGDGRLTQVSWFNYGMRRSAYADGARR